MIFLASQAWTQPMRVTIGINQRNDYHIFSFHRGGAHVALCDGAVRFLSEQISANTLGAILVRDDGQPINVTEL